MSNAQPQKMNLASLDIADERRAQLQALFPEAFSEGKVDFDQLKRALGEWVEPGQERFGLNWPGKAECMKVIQAPSIATLKPCRDESVNFDDTENLFIEGDNLEVLKLLQKSYFGKVKMIYIDPPYNTDGDFIYPDKYTETLDTYLEYTNQADEHGKKFSTTSETNGRYHSRWLNMMYTRLYLAKNLLKSEGVLVAHIDEHEVVHFQLLLDEIFGPENNLGQIIWDKKNPKGDATKIAIQHETILIYAKSIDSFKASNALKRSKENAERMLQKAKNIFAKLGSSQIPDDLSGIIKKYGLKVDSEKFVNPYSLDDVNAEYQDWLKKQDISGGEAAYKFIDKSGDVFQSVSMAWPNKQQAPDDYLKPLIHPVTKKPCPVPERGWRNPPATMLELLKKGLIIFGTDETTQPRRKYLLKENMDENIPSIFPFGGSDDALLKELDIPFDNPKPVKLSKRLIKYFAGKDDIVMDFFAGSATTAHACMELNYEDTSNYKFIMVQLPEKLDPKKSEQKPAFKFCQDNKLPTNIAELSKARIRRAITKINPRKSGELNLEEGIDFGFKVFKLAGSNFKLWEGDVEKVQNLAEQLSLHVDHINAASTSEDILCELLLKSGFPLATKVEKMTLADKEVFSIAEGALLICLDKNLTQEVIDAIADANPLQVICLDEGFKGNDQLKANAVQTFKARAQEQESEIVFRTV